MDFVLVSLHIKALHFGRRRKNRSNEDADKVDNDDEEQGDTGDSRTDAELSHLAPLTTALKEKLINEKDVILVGDFNMSPDNAGE